MTAGQSQPKKGRPPRFVGSGARLPHSVRLKPVIAEQLRAQAVENMRSIGEEIEARIDSTFLQEGFIPAAEPNDAGFLINYLDESLQRIENGIYSRINEHAALQAKVNIIQMKVLQKLVFDRIVDENSRLQAEKQKKKLSSEVDIINDHIMHYEEEVGILKYLQNHLNDVEKEVSSHYREVNSDQKK